MLQSTLQPSLRAGFLVTLALSIGAAPAHSGGAVLYNIPPGSAPEALVEWSRQTNLQVSFDYDELRPYRTRPVAATLQPLDALGAMLRDTPFTFSVVNEKTVAVIRGSQYCQPWRAEQAPLSPCVQMSESSPAVVVR